MAKLSLDSTIKLKSGYEIPVLGYGVSPAISASSPRVVLMDTLQLWKT